MKKIIAAALIAFNIFALPLFAEKKAKYISPNNDGVQDELKIPLQISDKRYVKSWSLVIMNEDHEVVRTIGNKVALPERIGFKSFFKQVVTVKQGIPVPEFVSWNGALDSGETAPDGTYYYYFTATDDNDNEGRTKEHVVIVDTIAPEVELFQPADKIFGEGAKATFKIKQEGSAEDLWTGLFRAQDGKIVKTVKWENSEPGEFNWRGTDDEGNQVFDGVYSYEVIATDRAGNKSAYTTIQNIIYSAEKPATNIFVEGSRYFSPKSESPVSSVTFNITIPVPEEKTGNKLTDWAVTIYNEDGNAVRAYNKELNGDVPPSSIVFDGTDVNGKLLPDGKYQAKVTAAYLNGYVPAVISSPVLVLDTQSPDMNFVVSDKVFGSGNKRAVEITMEKASKESSPVPNWKGAIVSADGTTVKSYDFGEFPPVSVSWSGITDKGVLAEKGDYKFVVTAEDMAGNKGVKNPSATFTFDTTEASLILAASDAAFSPNGDKVQDVMTFTPVSGQGADVTQYSFKVMDEKGTVVYSKEENKKLPTSITWNGKANDGILCADGTYTAELAITTANGSSSSASTGAFGIDTVAPSFVAETPWSDFSPDGDGNQDSIPVKVLNCSSEKSWTLDIKNAKNSVVKKISWNGQIRDFEWDGTDESGNVAPDGVYTMDFNCRDDAGNSFNTTIKGLTLDNRETKVYVITENEGISPNGDGILDTQKFEIKTTLNENITNWKFEISREDGNSVRSWSEKDQADLPANITWDGLDSNGNVCEGTFYGRLEVVYKKGNCVRPVSSSFLCTATPPQLRVQTAPEYFSPDNDGVDDDLFIKLSGTTMAKIKNWSFTIDDPKGRPFWTTNGKSQITERIIWDGLSNVQKNKNGKAESVQSAMDYPYTFTVTDNLGMTSKVTGVIPVDVLVIRDGSVLKMAVPSIIFLSDDSVFDAAQKTLTQEQVDKNLQVLNRIADILKKFKDYKVTIVGHANRTSDNLEEETIDNLRVWGRALTPLSLERAEAIKKYLIKKGVSASSISTDGKGGTEPVADPKDKDNNWKNRRVEFILQK
ncbi:MAG: gliding motility-associated C-terminal domain-containing protein [Treponema sp.]|nr:gliding motility-associated C-terminal domain-containing protein [Treponema sp.]